MRLLLALLVSLLVIACGRYTTNEFTAINVDFQNVDWYAKRAQLAYSDKNTILKELDNVLYIENIPEKDIQSGGRCEK